MPDDGSTESDGADAESEHRTTRVPKWQSGDEVVGWMEVPTEWREHVNRAEAVHDALVETRLDDPGVNSVWIEAGDGEIAGRSRVEIVVSVADTETAERLDLPDERDGISLVVEVE